jgi:ABC-type Zn uptake system ZnuABC Zn-binding protein ZnuA
LRHLVEEHSKIIAKLPAKKFLVIRPAWSALGIRFGLTEIHPIDAQIERLTNADVRSLREAAQVEEIRVLVLNSVPPPAAARDLESRSQLTLLSLDLLGSSASGGHRTYQDLVRYDLEQLETALK